MSATPDQHRQAADPATPPETLAALAAAHPELQPAIAANPAAYDGLLAWLREYGGPEVHAALAARAAAAPATPPPPAASPPPPASPAAPGAVAPRGPWQEPSRSIPLRWGTHDGRYTMALVAVGAAALLSVVVVPIVFRLVVIALSGGDY